MRGIKDKFAPICVTAAVACVIALAGCGANDGLTGGVAATVNGTDIAEDRVTTYIEDMRESQGMTDDDSWASWLSQSGYTPESLREAVINMFVTYELENKAAADAGIKVTDEEVDAVVESMKSNYDSDEAWQQALSSAGLTEERYRENVYQPMLEDKLLDAVIEDKDKKADDKTVLSYVQMYASALDGMKRSSHILFAADDKKTAEDVLDQLKGGADFAELAKKYSTDSGSAEKGGDVGWSGLNSFVDAYQKALDDLGKGETSGLVTSEYGIHIIRCTDVWNAPSEVKSLDDVPSELVDVVRTQMADPAAEQSAYSAYIENLRKDADIHVNDMPAEVSYNVDMSKYASSSSSDAENAADADESADAEAAEDEAAEGEASTSEASTSEAATSESSASETPASESSASEAEKEDASQESESKNE